MLISDLILKILKLEVLKKNFNLSLDLYYPIWVSRETGRGIHLPREEWSMPPVY